MENQENKTTNNMDDSKKDYIEKITNTLKSYLERVKSTNNARVDANESIAEEVAQPPKRAFDIKKLIPIIIAFVLVFSISKACDGSSKSSDSSGDFKSDTWYTYKEIDILKVQNCVVREAYIGNSGRSVRATYIPICKKCHEPGTAWMAAPEVDYPVSKTYHCDSCGANTTLKFKIQY